MTFEGDDLFAERPTEGGASESPPVPPEATIIQGAADLGPEINGVKVDSIIGTGGQGTVFLGRQEYLNRRVAVKVLHKATNPKLADRFRREATILAGLHHPNIVSCYSAGVSSSEECFMVMEFIDGPDLHDHVKDNGPVGLGLALDLMSDLADALAHGLEASVIHRDIKPQNVLLKSGSSQTGRGLQAKLTDLGLARFTDDKGEGFETTEQGAVLGTPTTMAPEQSDDPDSVDHRTDIYGLGCVFYWALTGKRAFFAKSMAALYRMKTSGEGLKKIEQDPDLPDQVKPLLVAMLAAEPENRPQTYEDLIKALADLKSGVAPEIQPRQRRGEAKSPSSAVRWLGLVVAVGALAGAGWFFTRSGGDAVPPQPDPQQNPQPDPQPDPQQNPQPDPQQNPQPDPQPDPQQNPQPDPQQNPQPGPSSGPVLDEAPGGIDDEPDSPARVVILASPLEEGEVRLLFDEEEFLQGWKSDPEGGGWSEQGWIPQDGGGDEDDLSVVRVVNQRGGRVVASRPAPSGSWTLTGDLFIGPTSRVSPWSASVELLAMDGRVLRVQLDYFNRGLSGSSEPFAQSSVFWSGPDPFDPAEGASQVSQQGAEMPAGDFLIKAKTSFRIAQDGETVVVYVDGHGTKDLTPPGDTPIFEAVRLVSDAGQGRWQALAFERPD